MSIDELTAAAKRVFGPETYFTLHTPPEVDVATIMHSVEKLLEIRSPGGGPGYTVTEIESCIIGLRPYCRPGHGYPEIEELMKRLEFALPRALTCAMMVDRSNRKPKRR